MQCSVFAVTSCQCQGHMLHAGAVTTAPPGHASAHLPMLMYLSCLFYLHIQACLSLQLDLVHFAARVRDMGGQLPAHWHLASKLGNAHPYMAQTTSRQEYIEDSPSRGAAAEDPKTAAQLPRSADLSDCIGRTGGLSSAGWADRTSWDEASIISGTEEDDNLFMFPETQEGFMAAVRPR